MEQLKVYVLRLENDRYYVGKTHDVETRYADHLNGRGTTWTKLYKPIELVLVKNCVYSFEEDGFVKLYMYHHGIDKVRGGAYSSEILSDDQIYFLKRELWSSHGACMRCGREGHYIKSCYATHDTYGKPLLDHKLRCERCERTGHLKSKCCAKTTINGYIIQ